MIKNSILIFDDRDRNLGYYFKECASYASMLINLKAEINQTHIDSVHCDAVYLDEIEFPKHTEKTLFVICSHGSDNRYLRDAAVPFIEDTINCNECLNGGLVYSIACSTGKRFGETITEKNASFYGYKDDIDILPQHLKISMECDNHGLYKLIEGATLDEAKNSAKEKFNHYIDRLNMFNASKLRRARDSLVVFGETTKKFF